MSIGIKLDNCRDVTIIDGGFSNLKTGIDISNSDDVQITGAKFLNVNTGVKARQVRGLKASNRTDDVSQANTSFRLSAIAQIVRWYIGYLNSKG